MSPSTTLSKSLCDLYLCWPPATCSFLDRLLKFTVQSTSSLYPVHPSCSSELNQTASTACIPHLYPDSGLSRAWRRKVCHPVQGCKIQSWNCRSPAPTHQQHLSGHLRILSTGVTAMLLVYSRMTTAFKNGESYDASCFLQLQKEHLTEVLSIHRHLFASKVLDSAATGMGSTVHKVCTIGNLE